MESDSKGWLCQVCNGKTPKGCDLCDQCASGARALAREDDRRAEARQIAGKLMESIEERVEWGKKGFPGASDGNTATMIATLIHKLAESCGVPGLMHGERNAD